MLLTLIRHVERKANPRRAIALTKNVNFSAKAFSEEPGFDCIQKDGIGGDHTDYVCPGCTTKEQINPSDYGDCSVPPSNLS